jgi:hypothetical protein
VVVDVVQIGYPLVPDRDIVRYGMWAPVVVDVSLLGQPVFDGTLRMAQDDTDGDRSYDEVEVHLREETGGSQRYYLYTIPNVLANQQRYNVELRNDQGEIVEVFTQSMMNFTPGSDNKPTGTLRPGPVRDPIPYDHDSILVLSITEGTIGRVRELVESDEETGYDRQVLVAHISPQDVPEVWHGLEMVDYVVWDNAKADDLNARQRRALVDWVEYGGTLLIAASRTAGELELLEEFSELLPVELGDVTSTKDLIHTRSAMLESLPEDVEFPRPIPIVECKLRDGAQAINPGEGLESALFSRMKWGRGSVIFSGVTLSDLFSGETGSATQLFQKLFYFRLMVPSQKTPRSLYGKVVGTVAFARSAGRYLGVVSIFSVTYLLVATWGTWQVLSRKGGRQHAWTAFGVVAVGAALLSVIMVEWQQGFGDRLHQFSIIDVDADDRHAHGTVFFGLKSSSDKKLDVWLPSDAVTADEPGPTDCTIRPVPAGRDIAQSGLTFVDPVSYQLLPGSAEIHDVRLRATLKRFEGRWEGRINGTMSGDITIRKNPARGAPYKDWRITSDSYIVNNLGVDLEDCYLIHPLLDPDGKIVRHDYRSEYIFVYRLGSLAADGQPFNLATEIFGNVAPDKIFESMEDRLLIERHREWGNDFSAILGRFGQQSKVDQKVTADEMQSALLLLSTIGEYDVNRDTTSRYTVTGGYTWTRDRIRQLDLRNQLRSDSVYIVGFANDPGPIRLFKRSGKGDYRTMKPEDRDSKTMYRIRIPVKRIGKPTGDEDPNEDART